MPGRVVREVPKEVLPQALLSQWPCAQAQTKVVIGDIVNAGFEMSAPIGIGVKISAGGDVSLNRRKVYPTYVFDTSPVTNPLYLVTVEDNGPITSTD